MAPQAHVVYSDFDLESSHSLVKPDCFSMKSRAEAVADWLEEDEAAMEDAERQVSELVARWLRWLRTLCTEEIPALRMDFLVRRVAAGRAEVHSLELTECGFSLLGWEDGPRQVLGALLASCFEDTGPTAAESAMLSAFHERPATTRVSWTAPS